MPVKVANPIAHIDKDKLGQLNERQRIFLEQYLKTGETKASAVHAGYPVGTAGIRGAEVLRKKVVRDLVQQARDAELKSLVLTPQTVLQKLSFIATADVTDLFEVRVKKGKRELVVRELASLPEAVRYAIKKVRLKDGEIQVELEDKLTALRLLGQALSLFDREPAPSQGPAPSGEMIEETLSIERRIGTYGELVHEEFRKTIRRQAAQSAPEIGSPVIEAEADRSETPGGTV